MIIFWITITIAVLFVTIVIIPYYNTNSYSSLHTEENKNATWFLKDSIEIYRIVISLSYLPARTKDLTSQERRKKLKLFLELREEVNRKAPDLEINFVHLICKELLLYSDNIRRNREAIS